MENSVFDILYDKDLGTVSRITLKDDPDSMNFCDSIGNWGRVHCTNQLKISRSNPPTEKYMVLCGFEDDGAHAVSYYSNGALSVKVTRFFKENGNFCENFRFKNLRSCPLYTELGNLCIELPFSDRYTFADECMTKHCNTHLWCAGTSSNICALKMGESTHNLGLALTKGSVESYSVRECKSNQRGVFLLNVSPLLLESGEESELEWEIFEHTGYPDFHQKLVAFPSQILVNAEHFTVFMGESINFEIDGAEEDTRIILDKKEIDFIKNGENLAISFTPCRTGEHKFEIISKNVRTYAEFHVSLPLKELIERRLDYIIENQQCQREDSALYGAFLVYDTRECHPVFDDIISDHNACRERVGMALTLIRYLQKHPCERYEKALDKYLSFLVREFYDEESGAVYNATGKDPTVIRLYNAPWIVSLQTEMYFLKKDAKYLENILKILKNYYSGGGEHFYPNGISPYRSLCAFKEHQDGKYLEKVLEYFKIHTENMIKNSTSYPKHEVNYEQTIVTPAADFITEMGAFTGETRYVEEAKKHIAVLERFNGKQPSYHLHDVSIRYWDGFWFGKRRMYGDVFPHYWSCLCAPPFAHFARLVGDARFKKMAEEVLRGCLCLFFDDGSASCAYMYPYCCNDAPARFYDEWANDQDFALYFAMDSGFFGEF